MKRIFHLYTGEGIGCRAIALRLTALGIPANGAAIGMPKGCGGFWATGLRRGTGQQPV